jgi:hypothetical protein
VRCAGDGISGTSENALPDMRLIVTRVRPVVDPRMRRGCAVRGPSVSGAELVGGVERQQRGVHSCIR